MNNPVSITFVAHPKSEADTARVVESLSRIATAFAMEGVWCELTLTPFSLIEEEIENQENS